MLAMEKAPPLACDAHMHVYDARFAPVKPTKSFPVGADAKTYQRDVQQRLGTSRTVVVTPRIYDTDNSVTLDAIEQLGEANTRGVAVLRDDVATGELARLDAGGIRGIRFTLYTPDNAVVGFDMVESLSRRVADFGWHVQLHWTADQIVEHAAMLDRLPSSIVFDHLARLALPEGVRHPAHDVVARLVDRGRTWIKLSGPYLDSRLGRAADYQDMDEIATHWADFAPDRVVWGSDWPHVTETDRPDDGALFDALHRWVPDPVKRHAVLVDNPAVLYGF